MIDRIGKGSLAQAAIEAALRAQAEAASKVQARAQSEAPAGVAATGFEGSLTQVLGEGLRAANASVAGVDRLGQDLVAGRIGDFSELPGRLKQAELTFKFSMEVRNKLLDAYREVMRMSV
jgi:flagellar hook-basal body complex protein FliE